MLCSRKGGFFGNVVILVINAVKCTLCLSKWLSLCRSTMPVNDLLESNWMSKLDGCRRRLGRSGGRMKRRSASRLKGILGGRSVPSRAEPSTASTHARTLRAAPSVSAEPTRERGRCETLVWPFRESCPQSDGTSAARLGRARAPSCAPIGRRPRRSTLPRFPNG